MRYKYKVYALWPEIGWPDFRWHSNALTGPEGFKGGLSAENYIAITGASRATATRDLQQLVAMGALVKTGALKSTRYLLNLDGC